MLQNTLRVVDKLPYSILKPSTDYEIDEKGCLNFVCTARQNVRLMFWFPSRRVESVASPVVWCHRTLAGPIGYQHSCDLRVRLMNMIISYCRRLRFQNNSLFWMPLSAYGVTHLFSTNGCDKFEIVNDHITLFYYCKVLGKFKTWKKCE